MSRRVSVRDDGWRLPDELWGKMEPLLPPRPQHPLGCHNPRVPDRSAMDAIFFVLRTGCQWNALNATGICSSSSAHRRFLEWTQAGVFAEFWRQGLLAYDGVAGIDWSWLALDGAMGKAPLGGEKKLDRQSWLAVDLLGVAWGGEIGDGQECSAWAGRSRGDSGADPPVLSGLRTSAALPLRQPAHGGDARRLGPPAAADPAL